ncbi:hypothetical protein BCR33DRAFT_790722 [Rhizoclosmatium globosum]|uniref:Phospholipid/glycerol acyltransferase domain-containing protein n=1 Tax=Rhizoclosmatium globosum TaxID=329046 RepID=A0A1Y2BK70_9FUNG|nr:hypothetical protein BCR33DRAFT_790722 [Rhizoclosmatium globosum]|eukprot:ORY35162.1 hypothetical protein BCR33DRAFT_790722 [Rhizoclosmatium globosum]
MAYTEATPLSHDTSPSRPPPPPPLPSRPPRSKASYVFRLVFFSLSGLFTMGTLSLLLVLGLPLGLVHAPTFRFFVRESIATIGSLGAIVQWLLVPDLEFVVSGDSDLGGKQLLFCNHGTFLDWWFLGLVIWHQGKGSGVKIMLMDVLKYIPFTGWIMWFDGFVFLKQKWALDEPILKKSLPPLANRPAEPLSLLMYPEGTLVYGSNIDRSKAFIEKEKERVLESGEYIPRVPTNVILPRAKGLRATIQLLNAPGSISPVKSLYDVTMGYWPSSRGFETGVYPFDSVSPFTVFGTGGDALTRVCIDFRRMEGSKNGVDALNKATDDEFYVWLNKRWELKDDLLAYFHESGKFEGFAGSIDDERVVVDSESVKTFKIVPRFVDFVRIIGRLLYYGA